MQKNRDGLVISCNSFSDVICAIASGEHQVHLIHPYMKSSHDKLTQATATKDASGARGEKRGPTRLEDTFELCYTRAPWTEGMHVCVAVQQWCISPWEKKSQFTRRCPETQGPRAHRGRQAGAHNKACVSMAFPESEPLTIYLLYLSICICICISVPVVLE